MERPGGFLTSLFLAAALVGVALALLAGARPRDLAGLELKAGWAFVLAALLNGGLALATYKNLLPPEVAGPLAKLLVLLLVGYGLWLNNHLRGLWFATLGLLSNTLVIFANGGHMPVSPVALRAAGMEYAIDEVARKYDAVHSLMDASTRLWMLGDIIPLRIGDVYHKVISIGDVYLAIGVALTILEGALQARRKAEEPFDIDLRF
ncbi:DUF5317 domain-containing protein [Meiothermus granaticius]|uniref:DUF5317 domain-containing protein n=1 Tax=Meiothermus granaticius TaxID=863370 RepID=UPI000E64E634|nr:DUF5317 domain-containing protein [Meiothermus granaticius]